MNTKNRMVLALVSALVLLAPTLSLAAKTEMSAEKDWMFNLAPFYLWAINISGDQTIGPVTAPLSVDFNDITDNLDGAFIVHFEGSHKSNWGFLVDINYLDLENKNTLPNNITRKVEFDTTLAEVSGFHRWNLGEHVFDLILGLRYVRMSNDISILGGNTLTDGSQDWIDPLVGGRWIWRFVDGWSLVARGDIGGLQVGSDFAWQAAGILEWQAFKYVSFLAGYRAIGMDYENGDDRSRDYFKFDATIHGPVVGINFKW